MGHDQFPKTVTAATDILSNHRFDKKVKSDGGSHDHRKVKEHKNYQKKNDDGSTAKSFAQFCYCCGSGNHKSPGCPKRKETPREQWVINKGIQHIQEKNHREHTTQPKIAIVSAQLRLTQTRRTSQDGQGYR